ncbi:unnamed protein product, partial [Prorocentrum cordatum]
FLPARSLAQPRDSTRVVPAVPCCRSQPHCSSGSRGRDGKTAWALAAGCRWTPEASGRAAQRRARATGAPAPADRPALARGASLPAGGRKTTTAHLEGRGDPSSVWALPRRGEHARPCPGNHASPSVVTSRPIAAGGHRPPRAPHIETGAPPPANAERQLP